MLDGFQKRLPPLLNFQEIQPGWVVHVNNISSMSIKTAGYKYYGSTVAWGREARAHNTASP